MSRLLAPPFLPTLERVDRRALGAFRFVDAVTRLPITFPVKVEVRHATLVDPNGDVNLPQHEGSVQLRQTRSGAHAILRAPFFDEYAARFDDPPAPPGLQNRPLRLRLTVVNAGPNYLPQEFSLDLPRALDRHAGDNVFQPPPVELFRTPGAPVLDGWAALRVRVTDANTGDPLPGVLVRVFASPRTANAAPLGRGVTEWRGDLRGEALVPVANLPRFRPGAGQNVFETTQAVHFEVVRDPAFTGAGNQLPDVPGIDAGRVAGLLRRRSDQPPAPAGQPPAPAPLGVSPPAPLAVRAGRETVVGLSLP